MYINMRNQLVLGPGIGIFWGVFFFGIATDGPLATHVVHFFSGSIKTGDIPRCWDKPHINLVAPKILDCIGCFIGT